jgi:DNA replication protein DnaD
MKSRKEVQILSNEEFLEKYSSISKDKNIWINTSDDVRIDDSLKNINVTDDLDKLIELRIFDQDYELQVKPYEEIDLFSKDIRREKKYQIHEIKDLTNYEVGAKRKHKIVGRDKFEYLEIQDLLKYDEDNQAYVYHTKLHNLQRKGEK